jgi:charged multivesicular body protein 5
MNRIFGSSKPKAPKPTIEDAIQKTDGRVDSILVKIRKLDGDLLRQKDQLSKLREGAAKQSLKQKAMRTLQQKKMYEQQVDQLQQQSFNMEQASMTTENLKNTMITMDAMQSANKELKKQYKAVNIDKIEAMQDEMQDLLEMAEEVQETIGRSYGVPDDIDDDALEAELDMLAEELTFEENEPSYLDEIDTKVPGVFIQESPKKEANPMGI